jgi:hypothetical protein
MIGRIGIIQIFGGLDLASTTAALAASMDLESFVSMDHMPIMH